MKTSSLSHEGELVFIFVGLVDLADKGVHSQIQTSLHSQGGKGIFSMIRCQEVPRGDSLTQTLGWSFHTYALRGEIFTLRPFRFGVVSVMALSPTEWIANVQKAEALGYSTWLVKIKRRGFMLPEKAGSDFWKK